MRNSAVGRSQQSIRIVGLGIFVSFLSASIVWYVWSLRKQSALAYNGDRIANQREDEEELEDNDRKSDDSATPISSNATKKDASSRYSKDQERSIEATISDSKKSRQEMVHRQVEDADKRGKAFFKAKKFLEAATCFTEALAFIENAEDATLEKQAITLLNNRSAMYEKAGLTELALFDIDAVIKRDVGHTKARLRKVRLLECEKQYRDALVEVCAIQLRWVKYPMLLFPVSPPPPPSLLYC
jgi:tetratricopeptide (TPR) repeat protein